MYITDSIFRGNSTDDYSNSGLHLGETRVICPGNHSAATWHSHVHINYPADQIQGGNDNVFDAFQLVADDLPPMFEQLWNKKTVPFFLLFLFPVISMRSVVFFTKFNVIGQIL